MTGRRKSGPLYEDIHILTSKRWAGKALCYMIPKMAMEDHQKGGRCLLKNSANYRPWDWLTPPQPPAFQEGIR